jgi:hypothetical protein
MDTDTDPMDTNPMDTAAPANPADAPAKQRKPRATQHKYTIQLPSFFCVAQLVEFISKYYPIEATRIINAILIKHNNSTTGSTAATAGSTVTCAFKSYYSTQEIQNMLALATQEHIRYAVVHQC